MQVGDAGADAAEDEASKLRATLMAARGRAKTPTKPESVEEKRARLEALKRQKAAQQAQGQPPQAQGQPPRSPQAPRLQRPPPPASAEQAAASSGEKGCLLYRTE